MLPILQTNPGEAKEFMTGQIGTPVIAAGILAVILFSLLKYGSSARQPGHWMELYWERRELLQR